jgi:ATP-dependent protease ClpP protease subunit
MSCIGTSLSVNKVNTAASMLHQEIKMMKNQVQDIHNYARMVVAYKSF